MRNLIVKDVRNLRLTCLAAVIFLIVLAISLDKFPMSIVSSPPASTNQILLRDSSKFDIKHFGFTNFRTNKTERAFWESLQPIFECPDYLLERVGKDGDGGKWTCGLSTLGRLTSGNKTKFCAIYSFGVKGDSSFEAEVLATTGCTIYAYDPTVSSIGPPLKLSNPRINFHKLGISGKNEGDKQTLSTIMTNNGNHQWVDILKIDIEGWEFPTLKNLFKDYPTTLPFGQLLIEFHIKVWSRKNTEDFVTILEQLEQRGLRLFYLEPNDHFVDYNSEFSFINLHALKLFLPLEEIQRVFEQS